MSLSQQVAKRTWKLVAFSSMRPSPPRLLPAKEPSQSESPAAARRRRDQYASNSAQPSIIEKTTRTLKTGPNSVSTVESSTTIAVGNDMYTIGECVETVGWVGRSGGARSLPGIAGRCLAMLACVPLLIRLEEKAGINGVCILFC